MSKKLSSMLVILVLYIMTVVFGVTLFLLLPNTWHLVTRILVSNVSMTLLIWVLSLFLRNASLYDPYWSVIPPLIMLFALIYTKNVSLPLILLLVVISLWSIRLTYNWGKLWQDFSVVDWRYEGFKRKFPRIYPLISFTGIMLFPTLIVYAQLVGSLTLTLTLNEGINIGVILSLVIILFATIIELMADKTMQLFKKDPLNKGKIMRVGLWKVSRHPNYFGEILMWWGVYLFYASYEGINFYLLAPILMSLMFLFISIPLLENKMLNKYGDTYVAYKNETRLLLPFPKIQKNTNVSKDTI